MIRPPYDEHWSLAFVMDEKKIPLPIPRPREMVAEGVAGRATISETLSPVPPLNWQRLKALRPFISAVVKGACFQFGKYLWDQFFEK